MRFASHARNPPRKDHRGVDFISDLLSFGRLWYGEPNPVSNATGYTEQWMYTDSQFWDVGQAVAVGLAAGAGAPVHEGTLYLNFTSGELTSVQTHS